MTSEISDKLLELTRYCSKNQISIEFLQYGAVRNVIEYTIVHGERKVEIEIGNPEEPNLYLQLSEFLEKLKGLISVPL